MNLDKNTANLPHDYVNRDGSASAQSQKSWDRGLLLPLIICFLLLLLKTCHKADIDLYENDEFDVVSKYKSESDFPNRARESLISYKSDGNIELANAGWVSNSQWNYIQSISETKTALSTTSFFLELSGQKGRVCEKINSETYCRLAKDSENAVINEIKQTIEAIGLEVLESW